MFADKAQAQLGEIGYGSYFVCLRLHQFHILYTPTPLITLGYKFPQTFFYPSTHKLIKKKLVLYSTGIKQYNTLQFAFIN